MFVKICAVDAAPSVAIAPGDAAGYDLQAVAEIAIEQFQQCGLAATRFAGDAENLAVAHLERDAIDGLHHAARRAVAGHDIVDDNHCALAGLTRNRSASAFDTRKKPTKIKMIEMIGGSSHHQRPAISAWYFSAQ